MKQIFYAILLLLVSIPCLPGVDAPKDRILVYVVVDDGCEQASQV